jgi:hypothetical protein
MGWSPGDELQKSIYLAVSNSAHKLGVVFAGVGACLIDQLGVFVVRDGIAGTWMTASRLCMGQQAAMGR